MRFVFKSEISKWQRVMVSSFSGGAVSRGSKKWSTWNFAWPFLLRNAEAMGWTRSKKATHKGWFCGIRKNWFIILKRREITCKAIWIVVTNCYTFLCSTIAETFFPSFHMRCKRDDWSIFFTLDLLALSRPWLAFPVGSLQQERNAMEEEKESREAEEEGNNEEKTWGEMNSERREMSEREEGEENYNLAQCKKLSAVSPSQICYNAGKAREWESLKREKKTIR